MLKQLAFVWAVCGVISLLCIGDAHAYIDPGTGTMLLQALLACGVAVLAFWTRIKNFILARTSGGKADSANKNDPE